MMLSSLVLLPIFTYRKHLQQTQAPEESIYIDSPSYNKPI